MTKTYEDYLEDVKSDGWALKHVPEALITPELCLAAVEQNGWALGYVPEALKTPEICFAAVEQDGLALNYVPEVLKPQIEEMLETLHLLDVANPEGEESSLVDSDSPN